MKTINLTKCPDPIPCCYDANGRARTLAKLRTERRDRLKAVNLGDAEYSDYKRWMRYYRSRENELTKPIPKGFEYMRYMVGCGRCDICAGEKEAAKVSKWSFRISNMIEHHRQGVIRVWRKGEFYEYPQGETFFTTLTFHNDLYPGCSWTRNLTNSDLRKLNSSPQFRRRSLREGRRIFKKLINWDGKHRGVKYVAFHEWGSLNTRRLHFHVFFFTPGSVQDGAEWAQGFLSDWQGETHTDQGDVQLVVDEVMSAVYASKYAAKHAYGSRVMASQFNWQDYEVKFFLDSHGLDVLSSLAVTPSGYFKNVYTGGDQRWYVFEESVPLSVISESSDVLAGLSKYLDGLSGKGVMVSPRKTCNPLRGGFLRCEENEDSILTKALATTHELPHGCSLRLVPSLSRRSLEVCTKLYSRLPKRVSEVLYARFMRLALGPALLYKVFVQVLKWYHMRLSRFTPLHQFTLRELTG